MYIWCLSSRAFYSSKCFVTIYNGGCASSKFGVAYPFSHSLLCNVCLTWLFSILECLELSCIWALYEHIVVSNSWFFLHCCKAIVFLLLLGISSHSGCPLSLTQYLASLRVQFACDNTSVVDTLIQAHQRLQTSSGHMYFPSSNWL